jgi:hypothetical protein
MSDLIILSGELNENINNLILDLSLLIKTEKITVKDYLELNPTKSNNRQAQFYKDIIIFGNEDIQLNNYGRITSNMGSFRINNTNLNIRQNLNVTDTIFIDYIGNTSDNEEVLFVEGGVISNITKLQNLILRQDITLGGNLKINGLLLNYGNTYISNSLAVNGNIYVGPNSIIGKTIYTNLDVFGNNKITYPLLGNIYGNLLTVSVIYGNNISGNIINNSNKIIGNKLISNTITINDIYMVDTLSNPYLNIGFGNINSIISVENIFVSNIVKTNQLELINLNVFGNISKLNIINSSDYYYANIINTPISTLENIYANNLFANDIYVNNSLIIANSIIPNLTIDKLNITTLLSNNSLTINGGLNVYNSCIITGKNIYNNVDGITVAENLITINSLTKQADSGISFSYSDRYIGYLYKYFGTDTIEGNSFVFGKINSGNVDNNDPIINLNSLLPIYVKGIEGNVQTGLSIGNNGNVIINSSNIYVNNDIYQYDRLVGNIIYSNITNINDNIVSNIIYANIYNLTLIDNQNVLISNIDQLNSNIQISNLIVATTANIVDLNAGILNISQYYNGANITTNTIISNTTNINGNITTNNLVVNGNVSCNIIFIENVQVYSNLSLEFISTNKTLNSNINIFTSQNLSCTINAPSSKIINNINYYQNNSNYKYLYYDNQFNGNVFISFPRGKINLNKEDNNRKLYFNDEQWIDLDNKSFYPYYQFTYLKGSSAFNDAAQGYACKLTPNGKFLVMGGAGENSGVGNIWLFERNQTYNNIPNMNWSETTKLFTQFNSNHPSNSFIRRLGEPVDCSANGSIVIGGARNSQINSIANRGAVAVFENINGSWTSNIIFDSFSTSQYFGATCSISNDGNKIAVGRNTDNTNTGNAFVYSRPLNGWTSGTYNYVILSGSSVTTNSQFGSQVKFGGENTLCVGGSEKVWIFKFNGVNWNEIQSITSPSVYGSFGTTGIDFSRSCDILTISAPSTIGEICVYQLFGNQYRLIQKIQSINVNNSDPYQGYSLAISGDGRTIVYGAPYNGSLNFGGIYIWRRFNNKWIEVAGNFRYSVSGSDGLGGIAYYQGMSISLSDDGSIMAVGGPGYYFGDIRTGTVGIYY